MHCVDAVRKFILNSSTAFLKFYTFFSSEKFLTLSVTLSVFLSVSDILPVLFLFLFFVLLDLPYYEGEARWRNLPSEWAANNDIKDVCYIRGLIMHSHTQTHYAYFNSNFLILSAFF